MPKEMLPIVDKPTIQYIVEEAIESGIEDIIIVTGKGKRAIEDHFDNNFELEENLRKKEKFDLLEKVNQSSKVDIHYIRQKEALGLGHAVWCARNFIGDEPFAVLLGDDIVKAEKPCLKQLVEQFEETNNPIIGVQTVPESETNRYGIVAPKENKGNITYVDYLVEKPKSGTAPSNLAIMGRYVLTPEIFEYLGEQEKGAGGEIQLTDALQKLNENQNIIAYNFEGKRYDVGEQLGFIKTTIEMALDREDLKEELQHFLREIVVNDKVNES
jgi:UTP--glucose-1-phosphate uridylyltransferase